ncbi:DUF4190 domain-containing protein [Bacillus sp. FJAT-45350]|uniref:DUF4190 domain-containing protein n=1 Tax=Bacillus sp. FJAT-45350 TaxID=2011014 RepID=UPI000BB81D56|nr:DUF4190 domain-containing protein [Bacillus sp. FJAT-45350]
MTDFNQRDERSLELEDSERDENQELRAEEYQEETAAEVAPMNGFVGSRPFADDERDATEEANVDDATAGKGVGTFALVLSILSLFFLPVLLGASGIIVGFISRRNGATGLGNWAIGIGAVSIILTVFFSPFF